MSDPLSQVVALLRPRAVFANVLGGRGAGALRYAEYGKPSFCIVLEGECQLAVDGHAPFPIRAGDFILLPATPAFTLASDATLAPTLHDPHSLPSDGSELRYGEADGPPDMRALGGAFVFDREDQRCWCDAPPCYTCGFPRAVAAGVDGGEETVSQRPGRSRRCRCWSSADSKRSREQSCGATRSARALARALTKASR